MTTPTRVATTATRAGAFRRTAALALVACGAVLMIMPAIAGAETVEGAATSAITIEQTPAEVQGDCVSGLAALTALTNTHVSTATTFVLTVVASAPLCEPITATAVVYAMPGNGDAWPQQFVEKADVTIAEAGTTVITFAKDCAPVQFDVVVGATPPTIAPWGEWHGPLLFPLDDTTAEQYFGCTPTPNMPNTPTTPTTTTPTLTPPPEVLGTTTTIAPTTSTIAPQTVAVQSATVTKAAPATAAARPLALTGSSSGKGLAAGLLLIGLGTVLFLASRRRNANA